MALRTRILDIGFDNITADDAVSMACEIISSGRKTYIVTPNPEIVWIARKDNSLKDAVNNAGIVLPDGVGIVLAAKILGTPLKEQVPGIDFIALLFSELSVRRGRIFLLGAKPGIAEEAGKKLMEAYPGLEIAGVADGYFSDDDKVIAEINRATPDLLLVCLGAPKQELWMSENLKKLDVRLCAGLGGALDVFAGNVKRAPVIFRRLGLEWFYRLMKEPWRIKRMIKLPLFVLAVILSRIRGRRP